MSIDIPIPSRVNRICDVLSYGRIFGHMWISAHMGGGYLAGYLRVIEGHPWYRRTEVDDPIFAEQHTGIDWTGPDRMLYPDIAEGWWFGFFCNHECDWPNADVAREYMCGPITGYRQSHQLIRTIEYVEGVCMSFAQEAYAKVLDEKQRGKKNG